MNDQHHLNEMIAAEHIKDLGREMDCERTLALLPQRRGVWRRGVGQAGRLLVALGRRLEGVEQPDGQIVYNR